MSSLNFYLTNDHAARLRTTFIGVLSGAVAGALVELLSGKLAYGVVACVAAAGCVEMFRALTYAEPAWKKRRAILALPTRRGLAWGVASAAALLLIAKLEIPRREEAVFAQRIRRISANPVNPTNIAEAKTVIERAKAAQIRISTSSLEAAGRGFVEASNRNPEAWGAALEFLDYKTAINTPPPGIQSEAESNDPLTRYVLVSPSPNGPKLSYYGKAPEASSARLSTIGQDLNKGNRLGDAMVILKGGTMFLDGLDIKNAVFMNVEVHYDGGPVVIENAVFVNCTFKMMPGVNSKGLAEAVLSGARSTTFSGV